MGGDERGVLTLSYPLLDPGGGIQVHTPCLFNSRGIKNSVVPMPVFSIIMEMLQAGWQAALRTIPFIVLAMAGVGDLAQQRHHPDLTGAPGTRSPLSSLLSAR
jgi:hypothetical protein